MADTNKVLTQTLGEGENEFIDRILEDIDTRVKNAYHMGKVSKIRGQKRNRYTLIVRPALEGDGLYVSLIRNTEEGFTPVCTCTMPELDERFLSSIVRYAFRLNELS